MDASQCVLPKLPLIRRNFTAPPLDQIRLPIQCWKIHEPTLVWVYFMIGFTIPLVALFLANFTRIRDFIILKIKKRNCVCKRAEADAETEEKAEIAEDLNVDAPAVDRLEQLALARARRSRLDVLLAEAVSPHTNLGQVLMGIGVSCSAVSLGIYLVKVSKKHEGLELCGTLPNTYQIIDLVANLYMLFYFIIRVAGTERKQKVITSMMSIVDYFTIPCVVMGVILNRYFTGYAFFRAYNFQWLVEILAYRRIVKSSNSIRLLKLIFLVFAIILIAGGFLHVAENMGDPWLRDVDGVALYNGQSIVFYRCFLYVYGRITLLDLSGMRMHTMLGRVIIYVFQILAFGIVAQAIPQIIERVKIKPDYDKPYFTSPTFIHIIVCGHINAAAMEIFLKEFYHADRDTSEFFKIVILNENKPDEDMVNLQERYFSRLDYLRGTVMNLKDLNRVRLVEAQATLIIADRTAVDTDAEDLANIMRVVSIKNYKSDAQVIVQLTQYHNKAYLQNIPSWEPEKGDIVICLAELRLGLLAQSCLAPGFSTLMANFFTTRSYDPKKKYQEDWLKEYTLGTALELYCRPFGEAFIGMTFTQACEFCYRRLKIVLLAIQTDPSDAHNMPQVSPPVTVIILPGTCGYFIAEDTAEADRARFFCGKCHADIDDVKLIQKCNCQIAEEGKLQSQEDHDRQAALGDIAQQTSLLSRTTNIVNATSVETKIWSYVCRYPASPSGSLENVQAPPKPPASENGEKSGVSSESEAQPPAVPKVSPDSKCVYDSTGMFYWVPSRTIKSAIINRKKAATSTFKRHIVVLVISQEKSQIVGLSSFILPLRSSIIPEKELRDIVVLGDPKFLEKEWKYLYNLPRVFIVKGTALNRSDLRSVNLNTCTMCVILGAPNSAEKVSDPTLLDKGVVLATLNVRAMKFSKDEAKQLIDDPDDDTESGSPTGKPHLTVPQLSLGPRPSLGKRASSRTIPARTTGYEVPLMTDLIKDSNVMFLDDEDTDLPGTEFYLTQPYSCGRAFAASVLDLLMITSFFNPPIVNLVNTIIFGGASQELERIMAEGAGLIGGVNISKPSENQEQIRVIQESVENSALSVHAGGSYGALFIDALCSMGLVTLGLYRQLEPGSIKRFVICNPPEDFEVSASDQIFALKRANWQWQPPLKTLRPSSGSFGNRIIDLDVGTLTAKLQSINKDVNLMQNQYQDLLQTEQNGTENKPRAQETHRPNEDVTTPLLSNGPRENGSAFVPLPRKLSAQTQKRVEADLRTLEHKLRSIKKDVALMQERYLAGTM